MKIKKILLIHMIVIVWFCMQTYGFDVTQHPEVISTTDGFKVQDLSDFYFNNSKEGHVSLIIYFQTVDHKSHLASASGFLDKSGALITSAHNLYIINDPLYLPQCCAIHVHDHNNIFYKVCSYVVHPLFKEDPLHYDIALCYIANMTNQHLAQQFSPQFYWDGGIDEENIRADQYGYTTSVIFNSMFRILHINKNVDFDRTQNILDLRGHSTFKGMSGGAIVADGDLIVSVHRGGNCDRYMSQTHILHKIQNSQRAHSVYINQYIQTQLKQWYHVLYKNNLLHQVDLPRLSCDHIEEHRPVLFVIQADLDYDLQLHFLRILKKKLSDHNNKLQDICDFFILRGQVNEIKNELFPEPLLQTNHKFRSYVNVLDTNVLFPEPTSVDYNQEGIVQMFEQHQKPLLIVQLGINKIMKEIIDIYTEDGFLFHFISYLDVNQMNEEADLVANLLIKNES